MTTDNEMLNTKAAAALVQLSDATLETWRSRGGGPKFHRVGSRRVVYFKKDLIDFVKGNKDRSDRLQEYSEKNSSSDIPHALRQALFAPTTEEAFKMISATQELLR